jgi:hypothetical protein
VATIGRRLFILLFIYACTVLNKKNIHHLYQFFSMMKNVILMWFAAYAQQNFLQYAANHIKIPFFIFKKNWNNYGGYSFLGGLYIGLCLRSSDICWWRNI